MNSSNSILALDKLPYDMVHKLACSANALGARHVRRVGRWWWSKQRDLMTCDVCARVWVGREKPAHADWCSVGRTQKVAQQIIALGSQPLPSHIAPRIQEVPQPKRLGDYLLGTPPTGIYESFETVELRRTLNRLEPDLRDRTIEALRHAIDRMEQVEAFSDGKRAIVPMCSAAITFARKVLVEWTILPQQTPDERSEGRTGRRRADGDSSGTELAPRFGEPLAWNPRTRQIVDRFGHVAADLNRTDLTPEEQQLAGPRMVLCMNFFAGDPSEMIRNAMAVFAEAKATIRSSPASREVYGPLVLDADETGTWYVQEGEGVRTSFHGPDGQVGARAFFTARKNLLRDEKQVGA